MGMTPEERAAMLQDMARNEGFGGPVPQADPVVPDAPSPKIKKLPSGKRLDQFARSLKQRGHYSSLQEARAALREVRERLRAIEADEQRAKPKKARPPRTIVIKTLSESQDFPQDPSAICPRREKRIKAKKVEPLFNGDGTLATQAARFIRRSDERLSPPMVEAQINTALVSYETGSQTEAMRLLSAIVHRYPESDGARFELGRLYLERSAASDDAGNRRAGRRWRKEGMLHLAPLAGSPMYGVKAVHLLARVLLKTGHPEEALPLIEGLESPDSSLQVIKTTLRLAVAVARHDVAACADALRHQRVNFKVDTMPAGCDQKGRDKAQHLGVSVVFPATNQADPSISYRLWNSGISHIHCITTLAKGLIEVNRRDDALALLQAVPPLNERHVHSAYRGPALDFLELSASTLVDSIEAQTVTAPMMCLQSAFNTVSTALAMKRNNPAALETLSRIAKLAQSAEIGGGMPMADKDAFMSGIQKLLTRKVKSATSFKDGKRRAHELLDMPADELAQKRAEAIATRENSDGRKPHLPSRRSVRAVRF